MKKKNIPQPLPTPMSLNILVCFGFLIGAYVFGSFVGIFSCMLVGVVFYQIHTYFISLYMTFQKKQTEIYALIVQLYAKCAKADGVVSKQEIKAMREALVISDVSVPSVAYLFDVSRKTVEGYPAIARRLSVLLTDEKEKIALLEGLYYMAASNGGVDRRQMDFLSVTAQLLGVEKDQHILLRDRLGISVHGDVASSYKSNSKKGYASSLLHDLLHLKSDATLEEIKRAYRQKVKTCHPDVLRGQGKTEKEIAHAQDLLSRLTAAYKASFK